MRTIVVKRSEIIGPAKLPPRRWRSRRRSWPARSSAPGHAGETAAGPRPEREVNRPGDHRRLRSCIASATSHEPIGSQALIRVNVRQTSRVIWTTVVLKMLKTNWGAMPRANMRSVTGTMTNFSLRPRSGKALQLSAIGPLKSACIARRKTIAVKSKPEHRHGCKRRRDGEGTLEDQEFADEAV